MQQKPRMFRANCRFVMSLFFISLKPFSSLELRKPTSWISLNLLISVVYTCCRSFTPELLTLILIEGLAISDYLTSSLSSNFFYFLDIVLHTFCNGLSSLSSFSSSISSLFMGWESFWMGSIIAMKPFMLFWRRYYRKAWCDCFSLSALSA